MRHPPQLSVKTRGGGGGVGGGGPAGGRGGVKPGGGGAGGCRIQGPGPAAPPGLEAAVPRVPRGFWDQVSRLCCTMRKRHADHVN